MNLLGNAIKFTQKGDVVLRAVQQNETAEGATIRFEVQDSGVGIPLEIQPRLFQAFTQADASTTRRFGGTGLGLAISRKIVEIMGGRIGVESAPGQGSVFWFAVPLEKQKDPVSAQSPFRNVPVRRTLVVDDNRTNREILLHQLSAWGVRCDVVDGAEAAMAALLREAAEGDPYMLVLSDMQMPRMDGLDLMKAVKASPALAGVRLVLMTSLGAVDQATTDASGLDACLTKPVRRSVLYDAVMRSFAKLEPGAVLPQTAPPAAKLVSARKPGRILIAEDVAVNRTLALYQLRKIGYEADAVANGLEALRSLKTVPYDLLLLDCHMPEMDGFEVSARLRAMSGRLKDLPIVAMTADALSGDRERCLSAGMNDYVAKPVDIGELEKVLARWMPSRSSSV